jgi:hypothetical protein
MQLRGPILPIDADQRIDEVLPVARSAGTDTRRLSDDSTDAVSPDAISRILMAQMPGSGIKTIVVDTLTPIIAPLVMQAMVDKDLGLEKSLAAAFRNKADCKDYRRRFKHLVRAKGMLLKCDRIRKRAQKGR